MLLLLWTVLDGAVEPPAEQPRGQTPAGTNRRPIRRLIREDEPDYRSFFQKYTKPVLKTVKRIEAVAETVATLEADNTLAEVESLLRQARQQRAHTEAMRSLQAQLQAHLVALEEMRRQQEEDEDETIILLAA